MVRLGLVLSWALSAGLALGDAVNDLEAKGRTQLDAYMTSTSKACTKDKLTIRKEWCVELDRKWNPGRGI